MDFKKILVTIIIGIAALTVSNSTAFSQDVRPEESTSQNDTIVTMPVMEPSVDSSLINTSVFTLLESADGGKIVVNRTSAVNAKFNSYIQSNKERKKNGYRILVYSSNAQNARNISQNIEKELQNTYPIQVYRSYSAPFFTVHIGDFRTKADAMKMCNELLATYPQAKIVRSAIDWYSF